MAFHKPTVASVETHTMGTSLLEYLRMKTHHDIQNKTWSRIKVIGAHARTPPARVADNEKTDKPFNWQRPTVTILDSETLQLQCFPGIDYTQHYAAIVATYLSLVGRNPNVVEYRLPSVTERMQPLLQSNLPKMGHADIVIIGYVAALERWTRPDAWEGGSSDELFSWQKMTASSGATVAFLGCRICFWGDIGANVVRALQTLNGAQCVIYLGKLGSLRAELEPNHWLATGGSSFLNGQNVLWENPLEPFIEQAPRIIRGRHYSLASVLDETKAWFEERVDGYDWVDPEIGHMAKASVDGGTQYGYLHLVSDNLARKYSHDLSNERLKGVVSMRKELMRAIQEVLQRLFDGWCGPGTETGRLTARVAEKFRAQQAVACL